MARKKKTKDIDEQVQDYIASIVVDSEYKTAQADQQDENVEFDALIDMLECKRNEKDYDWMSDTFIPEMPSILLTDASAWANQYFQSRDFVEVKLDGDRPEDMQKANAAKVCINKTLNDRDLYYYPKYIRMRTINSLKGTCYALCWWEREEKTIKQPFEKHNPVIDSATGQATDKITIEERDVVKPVVDRFNFDVIHPRNVFTDNKYCYTIQQKDWVTIRSELSYDELKSKEKINQYFNLDKVQEAIKNRNAEQTDTARETYQQDNQNNADKTPVQYLDVLDRYGKFWAIVEEKDRFGNATKAKPGHNSDGSILDGAELIETIITYVVIGNHKIMIRFVPTPFLDAEDKPYKPIIRGWCYIHPTKDEGLSDGKNMKELQIAINDDFNMGHDRVKLATLPVFKGKKYSLEDNSSVYIEPEHVIELENVEDLQELMIRDNIPGMLTTISMLTGKMQQATSTYPTTMGALPDKASTTATAVAGAEQRTNARQNYKALTFEYTFLTELYWMIMQMTYRFSHDETILKMLGDAAKDFDAYADYTYTPVTSNIESEFNKYKKIQLYDQTIGRISGLAKGVPEVMPIIAHMVRRQLELQGDEFNVIAGMIKKLEKAKWNEDEGQGNEIKNMKNTPASNQMGLPMNFQEMGAREGAMAAGGGIK